MKFVSNLRFLCLGNRWDFGENFINQDQVISVFIITRPMSLLFCILEANRAHLLLYNRRNVAYLSKNVQKFAPYQIPFSMDVNLKTPLTPTNVLQLKFNWTRLEGKILHIFLTENACKVTQCIPENVYDGYQLYLDCGNVDVGKQNFIFQDSLLRFRKDVESCHLQEAL